MNITNNVNLNMELGINDEGELWWSILSNCHNASMWAFKCLHYIMLHGARKRIDVKDP